ncbi:MAG: tetratricopeptide repeat protein [Armatimonadota bacterium]
MSEENENPAEQPGQELREHLFEADLVQLPPPDSDLDGFLPNWFEGSLPALVYPPLAERNLADGDTVDLQITPYHLYYGALRELAETAEAERGDTLRRLIGEWNPQAAYEVCEIARLYVEHDPETALLHYELALELEPELYEATQDAGMCQYALSTVEEEDPEERRDAAEELFRRAIELRPQSGLSWWSLARLLNDRGDAAGARGVLEQFLREQPEGEHREMIEQALGAGFEGEQPSDEQLLFQQAQALAFGENPAEAVEMLTPLAEAYPDSPQIWFVLGGAHRRAGDYAEAERCLRRASRLAPAEPFIWWELASAYAETEQWRAAEDASRRGLEFDPENPGFLVVLGRALLGQGDREAAEDAIYRAQELIPDDPEVQAAVQALESSR